MLRFLTTALDRVTLRMAASFRADGQREAHHAVEAEKLLNDPRFFCEFDGITPKLVFSRRRDFVFTSPVSTRWPENNRVHGKLFRAGPDWKERASVILLHGWSAELQYRWQFPLLAWRLARAGINACIFELPYHGRRTPREPGAIQNFISYDLLHMLEATRQAVSDARALLGWLRAQGSPRIGLWGVSLGAWMAGLVVCSEASAGFAVLLTPVAKVDRAIQELAFCEPIRCSLQTSSLRLDRLNLAAHLPLVPGSNLLIVESEHDLFAPAETVESLWRAWGQPEIWRLPHGHISVLLSPWILERIVRWIRRQAA